MNEPDIYNLEEKKIVICPFCNFENSFKMKQYKIENQKDISTTHLVNCKNCGEQFQITGDDPKSKISFGWPLI